MVPFAAPKTVASVHGNLPFLLNYLQFGLKSVKPLQTTRLVTFLTPFSVSQRLCPTVFAWHRHLRNFSKTLPIEGSAVRREPIDGDGSSVRNLCLSASSRVAEE